MPAQNRKALLRQLEETRNTVERQLLLKQIWRMDRELERQQTSETYTPLPPAPAFVVSVATTVATP